MSASSSMRILLYREFFWVKFSFGARKKCPSFDCPLCKFLLYRELFYMSLTVNPDVRIKDMSALLGARFIKIRLYNRAKTDSFTGPKMDEKMQLH